MEISARMFLETNKVYQHKTSGLAILLFAGRNHVVYLFTVESEQMFPVVKWSELDELTCEKQRFIDEYYETQFMFNNKDT